MNSILRSCGKNFEHRVYSEHATAKFTFAGEKHPSFIKSDPRSRNQHMVGRRSLRGGILKRKKWKKRPQRLYLVVSGSNTSIYSSFYEYITVENSRNQWMRPPPDRCSLVLLFMRSSLFSAPFFSIRAPTPRGSTRGHHCVPSSGVNTIISRSVFAAKGNGLD